MSNHPLLDHRHRDIESQIIRRWLPLIIGLSIGTRVALAYMHPFYFPDSLDYQQLAKAIHDFQPYQAGQFYATRMPGYPVFVALIYWVTNSSEKMVYVAQAILGGATSYVIYLIGRRINVWLGLLAALLTAVDPLSVGFSAAFLSETPFTFCLVLALWFALHIAEDRAMGPRFSWTQWALLGILWGIAVYLRASVLWAIVPVVLWIAFNKKDLSLRRNLLLACLTILLAFFVLSPWVTRNYRLFGGPHVRLTTLEGMSLYEAVYPGADGGPKQTTIPIPTDMIAMDEARKSDEWSRRAWDEIRKDPARIARLAIIKFGRTWSPTFNDSEFNRRPIQIIMLLWHVPLYIFGLLGLCTLRRSLALLVSIPLIYFSLIHALFLGSVRYRVPLMPLVCLLAAAGVFKIFKWISAYKRRTATLV